MPEFGDGLYLEIPMAAASRKCLVRKDEASTGSDDGGEILTRVKDNKLYVPVGDFDSKYRDYAERAFKKPAGARRRALRRPADVADHQRVGDYGADRPLPRDRPSRAYLAELGPWGTDDPSPPPGPATPRTTSRKG